MKKQWLGRSWLVALTIAIAFPISWAAQPRNIILLVGDGMGREQIKAAGCFAFGKPGTLCFESLPAKAEVTTFSAPSPATTTDSAAAATAMAAGHKVSNGVLSICTPGDASCLPTVLEHYRQIGKRTGLVTTSYITDATPAAFASHVSSRGSGGDIARQMLAAKVNVLFGAAADHSDKGMTRELATKAGYEVALDRQQMLALKPGDEKHFSGQFAIGRMPYEFNYAIRADMGYDRAPHLSEMAAKALELLDCEQGFFVMIEGGNIDAAGHANDLPGNVYETLEFNNTVRTVLNWAKGRTDTLIIVTADHETGGLSVTTANCRGQLPTVNWSTLGHTNSNVMLFGQGPGSEQISGVMDNTDVCRILKCEPKATTQPVAESARQ